MEGHAIANSGVVAGCECRILCFLEGRGVRWGHASIRASSLSLTNSRFFVLCVYLLLIIQASAAIGLAGTVVYKWLTVQRKCSLVTTGMWSILFQLVCITVAFVSLFVLTAPQFYNFSMALLIGGVCLSRIGLWVFDMTVTQLQQEFIPDGVRGVVGGTQHALNAFFQLSSFGLCLLVPDPRDFPMTVTFGYVAVCLSAISYYVGVYLRKHEFDVSLD